MATEPKDQAETPAENLPTINDTAVQTDLPEATDGSQRTDEASEYETFMVTLGGRVYSIKARNSVEAGKKAQAKYEKETKETK
jgi:hypothetical protein